MGNGQLSWRRRPRQQYRPWLCRPAWLPISGFSPTALLKMSAWDRAFWPVVASITIITSWGCAFVLLIHGALDFFKLFHKIFLGMKPARRINKYHIRTPGHGCFHRVIGPQLPDLPLPCAGQYQPGPAGPRSPPAQWRRP